MGDSDPASLLSGIRELIAARDELTARMDWSAVDVSEFNAAQDRLAARVPALLAAVEATLEQADDLTRKSEALDAEAEYVVAEHPEAAAVAVLKRERSIAYDECARWFRAAITAALAAAQAAEARDG
jgi:outer membrane murein-binding lipoprotein Lpp